MLSTRLAGWTWMTRFHPGAGAMRDAVIRRVAWDGDGRCLAATNRGLAFFTGTEWREAPTEGLPDAGGIHFVRRIAAGRWLVGGEGATVAVYTADGVREVIRAADPSLRFTIFHGDVDDIAVLVGTAKDRPPTLHAVVGQHWLKACPLPDVATLSSIARIDEARWLLTGRGRDGKGYAAIYSPLDWDVAPLATPPVRAFLAAAGHPDRRVGVAVGTDGAIVWYEQAKASLESIDAGFDLSAAGVDVAGRGWAAGAGRIWLRQGRRAKDRWSCVWEDDAWTAPMVSMFAEVGVVIAVTADGGIIEGRSAMFELSDTAENPVAQME
jgi:hypothetical protein